MKLVLDIETTYVKTDKKTDPSPYHALNKLVSVGYQEVISVDDALYKGDSDYYFFNHKELEESTLVRENTDALQNHLDGATLVIGHNLKFDMSWLYECGFKYSGKLWDTMIFEYVISKGLKPGLSLGAVCERYGLTPKKDILQEYIAQGVNVDEIPADILQDYGQSDIQSTYELYLKQQTLITMSPEVARMLPAIELMNDILPVLIQMERDGIYINQEDLKSVELEYRTESARLEKIMNDMVVEVMGHRPINLNSTEHLSWIIYSRKVKDKNEWAELFNIGTELRGSVVKQKYPPRYPKSRFSKLVQTHMETLYRQDAEHCTVCEGLGKVRKVKKNGDPFAKETRCSCCDGAGFTYHDRSEIAGFKVQPIDSTYAASAGFATDKRTIDDLLARGKLTDQAKEFLGCLQKYNAIQTYLSTFVEGIQRGMKGTLLHTTFNQCVTATARLSSSNPNFQNLPRGKTFPVRKVIQSRFKDGWILEADFSQLEFRTAAMLSGCCVALKDIIDNVDIHNFTAEVLTNAGQPTDRQTAKAHTFKPLYGGLSGTEAEVTYYKAFLDKYEGIKRWHEQLCFSAITDKQISIPSGRYFAFPNARRIGPDRVSGKTQIVNYPVQSFATADIVWVVILDIVRQMRDLEVRSKLILQVHDSVAADVHPEEKDLMIHIFRNSFNRANSLLKTRFNFDTPVPIGYEIAIGKNLMEKTVLK